MFSNKPVIVLCLSLITGLTIFFITPSDQYKLTPRSIPFYLNQDISNITNYSSLRFIDSTLQKGLFFTHEQGDHTLSGINESLGPGACVIDYNNDGWQDLFLVNGSGQTRFYGKRHWWQQQHSHQLYKNINGSFINATKPSGLNVQSWGMGCVAADFNNDGYYDLLITNIGANQLFKNNGNGTFSEIKSFSKMSPTAWSTSACSADFDGDGLLDLYIANYVDYDKTKLNYEGQSEFNVIGNEFFNPLLFAPVSNRFYKNTGKFSFVDITVSSGLIDTASRSLAVRCQDINNDSKPDIIVGNEKGEGSNRLYLNQDQFLFTETSKHYQFQNSSGTHSIDINDINNDGHLEIALTSGTQQNLRLYQKQLSSKTNRLLDIARSWGLTDDLTNFQSNWGGAFHDFNQDGLVDFFAVNGFLEADTDAPHVAKGQPNQFWISNGKRFLALNTNNSKSPQTALEPSRGAVFADFDNDGDMDIYISNNNNLGQLLINDSPSTGHWLGIKLSDKQSKQNIIGSRVTITGSFGIQTRIVSAGDSFLSDSEDRVLFGLGHDKQIDKLTIYWSNGANSEFINISIDQYLHIDLNEGILPYTTTAYPKPGAVRFPIDSKEPAHIALFLSLFYQQSGLEKAQPYFSQVLAMPDSSVKKVAIKLLASQQEPISIALLTKALNDSNTNVAQSALQALCGFEEESSIRWLIAALSNPRDNIRKTAANCFEQLFREEEAMIHRKYLALPSLIKLLSDTNTDVQIASAKALAEAEQYRAVEPLISLLDSENADLRAEAARSLGLIREKKAVQALLKVLHKVNEQPKVIAQTFIALKRLGYIHFQTTFESFFLNNSVFSDIKLQVHSNTLSLLSDTAVISPSLLLRTTTNFISQHATNEDLILELIPLITNTSDQATALLLKLCKSRYENIRLKAFETLMSDKNNDIKEPLLLAINDPSDFVKNTLFQKLAEKQIAIPIKQIGILLKNPATTETAIQLLGKMNNKNSAQILTKQLSKNRDKVSVLQALMTNSFVSSRLSKPFLISSNTKIRENAFSFYLNKLSKSKMLKAIPSVFKQALDHESKAIRNIALLALTQRKELWAIKVLEHAILNTKEDANTRLELINKFNHPFRKKWQILLKLAANTQDSIRPQVLTQLSYYNAPPVISFFKNLALKTDNNLVKTDALEMLSKVQPSWALNFLTNQQHP